MYFIDKLSIFSLIRVIPSLIDAKGLRSIPWQIQYFSTTTTGFTILRILGYLGLLQGEEIDYSLMEIRDAKGVSAWERCFSVDPIRLCAAVESRMFISSHLIDRISRSHSKNRLILYLKK